MPGRLRFYARGTALVTDPHAAERGVRRFIGRRWQEVDRGRWAWAPTEKPQEVDYHADLAKACRDGDLWPADEATAKALKVGFDPTFGGEKTETIKEFRAKRAAQPGGDNAPGDKAGDKAGEKSGGKADG